ncbi:MAG: hypothetical protein AAF514_17320 [Verrucomicrobiota bacterium]
MNKIIPLVTLLLGLVAGFGLKGLFERKNAKVEPVVERRPSLDPVPRLEWVELKKENERLRQKFEEVAELSSDEALADRVVTGSSKVKVKVLGAEGIDMDQILEDSRERERNQSRKRIELKVASLRDRLGLSEDQARQVRELLEAEEDSKQEGLESLIRLAMGSEDGSEEGIGEVLAQPGGTGSLDGNKTDAAIADLLSEDQKEAFGEYLEDRRANEIEMKANQQLASLQAMFDLSGEQKDAAFDAFARLEAEQMEEGAPSALGIETLNRQREARMEALQPVLTPEQMEVYRNSAQVLTGSVGNATILRSSSVAIDEVTPPVNE